MLMPIQEAQMAMESAIMTRTGIISVVAIILVTTRYLNGFVPDTSIASICSVTFIEPSSAPMLEPILPAQINAVMTGPISRTTDSDTIAGSHDSAPNRCNVGRDCTVRTRPMMK